MSAFTAALRRILSLSVLAFSACAALLTPGTAWSDDADPDATAAIGRDVGAAVYGASFKNMRDVEQSLAPYRDKTLILYFWATWCVPCRGEAVDLIKLDKELAGSKVAFAAIAMSNGDEVRQFVADKGIDYTMLYGGRNAEALTQALGNVSRGVPFFAIIKDGRVVDAFHGDRTPAELKALAKG